MLLCLSIILPSREFKRRFDWKGQISFPNSPGGNDPQTQEHFGITNAISMHHHHHSTFWQYRRGGVFPLNTTRKCRWRRQYFLKYVPLLVAGKSPLLYSITLNTIHYIGSSSRMYCIAKQVFIAGKQIDYPSFLLLRWFSKYFDVLFSGAMSTS